MLSHLYFSFAYFFPIHRIGNILLDIFLSAESEEAIDSDVRAVDFEFMQEPEDIVKEFKIYQEKDYPQLDVSQVSKSKQDAEKLAIELLATRLEYF